MRTRLALIMLIATLWLPKAFAEIPLETEAPPALQQPRQSPIEQGSATALETAPDREPAAARSAPRESSAPPPAAAQSAARAWPSSRWELGFFGGLATSAYGSSVSSQWAHQYFQSPVLRLEGSYTRKVFNENWTFAFSADGDFIRTYETQSSSRSTASLTSQYFLYGFSLGLRYAPLSWGGFGLRFALGSVSRAGGSTQLDANGFSTDVESLSESGSSVRIQGAWGLQYRLNPAMQLVLESRTLAEAHSILGGFEYGF